MKVFENRVLRRIYGSVRAQQKTKLHNKELYKLYYSSNRLIIRDINSRKVIQGGHVA
jgi:hypothetical protein